MKLTKPRKRIQSYVTLLLTIFAWFTSAMVSVYAQSIDGIVEDGADYLISRMGPSLFLVGIVITGISLALGNIMAVKKGAYVVAGGIIVMAAQGIFNAVASFAR